jgi:CubicO group peptidase (beta-lactamase class C family)
MNLAPSPALGSYADGFAPLAEAFATHLRDGDEIGAGLTVYHHGECVADLWGGLAHAGRGAPWQRDTRAVVFSVTKGLTAMALALLADRGKLEWDAPVATYWPGFARAGKEGVTCRTLFNHRAGLAGLDTKLTLDDCVLPERAAFLVDVLERQRPLWEPDKDQGYHAITFGIYARELFERIAGERLGAFLERELFEPLAADVSLGTPASVDARIAELYPPPAPLRLAKMFASAIVGDNSEARVLRATLARDSMTRRAFFNPAGAGPEEWNKPRVRRAELASGGATASAHGLARAYLPFALGGAAFGRAYLAPRTLAPVYERQGWSTRDRVLQKALGWSQGFLKEETSLFSPTRESFGHAGIGGSLGWCDPVHELTFGYVMNRLDWRVRSPRALALCHALYDCEPVRDEARGAGRDGGLVGRSGARAAGGGAAAE